MSVHDGHRQRLKDRFLNEGLDNFTEVQVLELLLFYCIPRQDTNELAHALIERFGGLPQVMEADPKELEKVKGIGANAALLLNLIPAAGRYYSVERAKCTRPLLTIEECGQYLMSFFKGRREETVFLLCLDAKCKVLCCRLVGEGSVNSASVPVRKVVETALAANATTVVLAHNHPSGLALPSGEDVATTRRIAVALDAVEIALADHLVVADEDFVSMAQSGYYRPNECVAQF